MKKLLTEVFKRNNNKGITFIYSKEREESLSYSELYILARRYLGGLQKEGLSKGSKLIFQVSDNKSFVIIFWACVLGGIIAVPVTLAITKEEKNKLHKIKNILKDAWVITDDKELLSEEETYKTIIANEINLDDQGDSPYLETTDTVFIQFSSGSTGDPKGVVLNHSNIIHNTDSIINGIEVNENDISLSWMPLTHDMGLIGFHITPLVIGNYQYIMPTSLFIKRPLLWLDKIDEHKATVLSSPNFGLKFLLRAVGRKKEKKWDLSTVKLIINGAEPISLETCNEFLNTMKKNNLRHNVIFPVYGLAEATLAVTFTKIGQALHGLVVDRSQVTIGKKIIVKNGDKKDTDIVFVSLGKPVKYTEIRITSDNNEVLSEQYVGNIEIKGAGVTNGYYNNEDVNYELYTDDKWLKTGDIGFIHDGELYIAGRKKDIIFINGQNYYSSDIEEFIEQTIKVKIGSCVACTISDKDMKDELYIFLQYRGDIKEFAILSNEIKNVIAKDLRLPVKHIIPCNKIHKTTSGKVKRYKFVEELKEGLYNDVINEIKQINMKDELKSKDIYDIENNLIGLFKNILDINEFSIKDHFIALGGDSLNAQQLISEINKIYNINMELKDIYEDLSVEKLTKRIISSDIVESEIIPRCILSDKYPVLPSQEQLYILNEMPTTDKLFNLVMLYDVVGKINKKKIEESINKLIQHYEILRTSFDIYKSDIFQRVHDEYDFYIKEVKITSSNLYSFINNENSKFDLKKLPLFKIVLIKLENGEEKLLIIFHHIIVDGTSLGIFIKKVQEIYHGKRISNEVLQFKDYAVWRQQNLLKGTFKEKEKYWINEFLNGVPQFELSIANKSSENNEFIGSKLVYKIGDSTVKAINSLSYKLSLSRFTILFAAYSILLCKYNKSNEIVIGVPYANRKNIYLENSIGMFINTLPIKLEINSLKKISEFLRYVHCLTVNSFDNCEYYSEELLRKLQSKFNITNLYNTVFIMQNMDIPNIVFDETRLQQENLPIEYVKTELTFEVYATEDDIEINIEFLANKYNENDIYNLAKYYEKVIQSMYENLNGVIFDIFSINNKEKIRLLSMSKYKNKNDEFKSFSRLLDESVEVYTSNIALKYKDRALTYCELNRLVNNLAYYLKDSIPSNKIIGIWMNHSIEQIITILAVLKVGAAYLPIDKMYPAERIDYILQDSDCKLLIVDEDIKNELKYHEKIINMKFLNINDNQCYHLYNDVSKEDLAYIIYTSGSTGKPKGVMVEHGNLTNYIDAFLNEFNLDDNDVIMQQASVGFDASIEEIYPILTRGGAISIVDKEELLDIDVLYHYLKNNKITIISVSPHLLNEINKIWSGNQIHTFISGGDVIKREYINNLFECGKVYNTYGPTEATVCATYYQVKDKDNIIPIGSPIKNYEVYILDKNLQLCGIGEEGEICISGLGVTRGYLNNETLTREKFIENPYNQQYRLYRTGDIGCWIDNEQIEYRGRYDDQLNIRGYRIEAGEIEARLLMHKEIDEVIVVGKERNNDLHLCAYIKGSREFTVEEMHEYLEESLADYMIPKFFVNMKRFPMNANGKIDKRKLPEPFDNIILSAEYIEPKTKEEKIIANMWSDILGVKKIGINDNFFDLGGQSLKAIKLASKLEEKFLIKISINYVFENFTIKAQAENLMSLSNSNDVGIKKVSNKLLYNTSYMQKNMFSIQHINKQSTSYNILKAIKLEGNINVNRVKEVIDILIERHEAFRTAFILEGIDVYQKIYKSLNEEKFTYINAVNKNIDKIISSLNKPFDLKKPGAFHIYLIKESSNSNMLLINIHHIIADAVSIEVFLREFCKLYEGKELQALNFTYKDYAEWQNNQVVQNKFNLHKEFWKKKLEDNIQLLQLPYDFDKTIIDDDNGDTYSIQLSSEMIKRLNEFNQNTGTTSYMFLISVFSILLSKSCNQEKFFLGSPVINRNNSELFGVVGVFINTIIQKFNIDKDSSFNELLKEVKTNTIDGLKHQEYPFSEMEKLITKKDVNMGNKIFNVMFSMIELESDSYIIKDNMAKPYNILNDTAMFDLTLEVLEIDESITLNFEYKVGMFSKETIERMASRYIYILQQIIDNPRVLIKNIDVLPVNERNMILQFSRNKKSCNSKEIIYELIDKQAINNPNNIALRYNETIVTYKELREKTNILAQYFKDKGVSSGDVVAIYMEPSADRIIAMLGVLKSGAAYLPIDKSLPINRIKYMLEDSKSRLLYTDEIDYYIDSFKGEVISQENLNMDSYSCLDVINVNVLSDLAYIIYTSGSTGVPKVVMVEHRNLTSYVDAFLDEFNINNTDVMMQQASIAFDASIEEIFPILTVGGSLAIPKREEIIDNNELFSFLKKNGISIVSLSPHLLNEINKFWRGRQIHTFISGGDMLRKEYYSNLIGCGDIYNTYGPSETTVCATYYKVKNEESKNISIGSPIKNYEVYIVDDELKLCPIGVQGEIAISGVGVARGYLNNKVLTNEKFINNPFNTDEMLYLSGDLGRCLSNGNIEYLGRKDDQINIRGYRIELGEIENILLQHKEIEKVVAISRKYKGDSYICAYIKGKRKFSVEELKIFLKEYLPSYMVPSFFVNIESIPFNASGKIDKNKLPEPFDQVFFETEYIEPRTDIEKNMAGIWSELLGLRKISLNDNFFELGGQSLKAIVLTKKIQERFGVSIPTSAVFKNPYVKDLCRLIKKSKTKGAMLKKVEINSKKYKASQQQRKLFVLQQMSRDTTQYNMPAIFLIKGNLNIGKLEDCVNKIIKNNLIYRTSFEVENDIIIQNIHDECRVSIEYHEDYKKSILEYVSLFIRPFNLKKLPLIRIGVNKIEDEKYVVVFDIHHIISDGKSVELLMTEILQLYYFREINKKDFEYVDFSQWQNEFIYSTEYEVQKKYWLNIFTETPPVLSFSTDYLRPPIRNYEGDSVEINLSSELSNKVNNLVKELQGTNFMLFYSIYSILLSKYTSQDDFVIGIPTQGRSLNGLETLHGNFVNTLPIRNLVKKDMTFTEYFNYVKENLVNAFDHEDYAFDELVNELKVPYDPSRNPLFDTMFSYMEEDFRVQHEEFSIKPIRLKYNSSKFDLGIDVIKNKDTFTCILNYSTQLFKEETIKRFLNYFINILQEVFKDKTIPIKKINMMNDNDKNQLIKGFNNTDKVFKENRPIVFLIEEQCIKTPDNIAIEYKNHYMTYNELYLKSNALSEKLIGQGVGTGDFIPVIMGRGMELVVSIYSIMKTGAAYVPIDMHWPVKRIKSILSQLNAKVIVLGIDCKDLLREIDNNVILVECDKLDNAYKQIDIHATLDSPLYIIYTSGSTGKPKGVVVPNRGILNRFLWMNDYFENDASKSVLQTTNHIYDSSVWQFFWPLINGGKTVLPDSQNIMNADYILDTIHQHKITMIDFVPSVFNTILYQLKDGYDYSDKLKSLKAVILGGEEILPKTVYFFKSLFNNIRIFNLYGPTEASIGCICHEVLGDEGDVIPIGKPISNVKIYILDSNGNLAPIGVPGEIYIGGVCVADGYYKDDKKTKEAFIENPLTSHLGRVYKTGDIAKYKEDGEILYLQRKDNQIKIRGFRIELGEIESVIRNNKAVTEAVVVTESLANKETIICAYLVGSIKEYELKEELIEILPYYMVPTYIYKLDSIPLTPSGKINRKLLPKPIIEVQGEKVFIPTNYIETKLQEMYKNILKLEKINANLNFFEQGGNSLSATILLARINKEFSLNMVLGDIFINSSIPAIAEKIVNNLDKQDEVIERVEQALYYEASPSQKRMLVLDSLNKNNLEYNMPMVFSIKKGKLDINYLEDCINKIITRHQSLRTFFGYVDGIPVQFISNNKLKIETIYINNDSLENTIRQLIKPFNLMKDLLIRAYFINSNLEEKYLFIDMHHIISDGVSMNLLLNELQHVYNGKEFEKEVYQYVDYSNWYLKFRNTEKYFSKKNYWLNQFKTLPSNILFNKSDIKHESNENCVKNIIESIILDKDIKDSINEFINKNNITLYMYMLAVFNTLLYRFTQSEDIAIGTPVSGRVRSEFEDTIGLFVNTIVIRNKLKGNQSFVKLLEEIKQNVILGIENQEYGIDDLVSDLKLERKIEENPLFNIMYLVERVGNDKIILNNVELEPYDYKDDKLKFDMNYSVIEYEEYIKLELACKHNIISNNIMKVFLKYLNVIIVETLKNPIILLSDIPLEDIKSNDDIEDSYSLEFDFSF